MSVYIHIPFCSIICSYCDFCKMHYNEKWADQYLSVLKDEITSKYKGEIIETIYIGGGTPSSLNYEQLKTLLAITSLFQTSYNLEFTFECNLENIDLEKLRILKEGGVNRLSIGVQTFNNKFLKFLNRHHTKEEVVSKIKLAQEIGFDNINIDLIYALKDQSIDDLKFDIKQFLSLNINHISTYSLIIEPNTKLYISKEENIDEDIDRNMYDLIKKELKKAGYIHYETSNFAKAGYESKHNLVYWNNKEYYGFGLGAAGYYNSIRYENTRSLTKYLKHEYLLTEQLLTKEEKIFNHIMLGFRKIGGINKQEFFNLYNTDIHNLNNVNKLLKEERLKENATHIYLNEDYTYVANTILLEILYE